MISWDKICQPKCEGTLSITRTQDVNTVLLEKLEWKTLIDPNNLWVKVVFTNNFTEVNFLEAKKSTKASTIWKYTLNFRYIPRKNSYVGYLGTTEGLIYDMINELRNLHLQNFSGFKIANYGMQHTFSYFIDNNKTGMS